MKGKIGWIKPKEIHALHEILINYGNFFPGAQGPERISFTLEKDGVQEVLDRVRQRHDATELVASQYVSGNIPVTFVAKMLGVDPVDAFYNLIASGHDIRTCVGSQQERDAAFAAIEANASKGCVIDAISLESVRRLDLADVIAKVCGPIGITAATPLRVQQKIFELKQRIEENDMSMFWRDGQYFRQETAPEQKQEMKKPKGRWRGSLRTLRLWRLKARRTQARDFVNCCGIRVVKCWMTLSRRRAAGDC
jgi:hypothetical protein